MKIPIFTLHHPVRGFAMLAITSFGLLPRLACALDLVRADGMKFIDGRVHRECADFAGCLRSCESGAAPSCEYLGLFYSQSTGPNQDDRLARRFFRAGCDVGSDLSCRELGRMTLEDDEKKRPEAAAAWESGCVQGGMKSCAALAEMDTAKQEDPAEIARASEFRERADRLASAGCGSSDTAACFTLAGLLAGEVYSDLIAEPPSARAVRLAEMDCRSGDGAGCIRLAGWYSDEKNGRLSMPLARSNFTEAERAFRAQCDGHPDWVSCRNLLRVMSELNEYEDWHEISQRLSEIERPMIDAAYEKFCSDRDGESCFELARRMDGGAEEEAPGEVARLYRRACDLGFAAGCVRLALMFQSGDRVDTDLQQALRLFEAGCAAEGCAELAAIYGLGIGVPADLSKSMRYEEQGCSMGDDCACRYLHSEEKQPLPVYGCTVN